MGNNLSAYTKIIAKSAAKGLLVGVTGCLFSVICIIVSFVLAFNGDKGVTELFSSGIWTLVLMIASAGLIFFYFSFATKTSLMSLVHLVWKNKLADFITPKITGYVQILLAKQPGWLKSASDKGLEKMKLVDAAKNDSTLNKVEQKILVFGLKKIKLDKMDLQNVDAASLPGTISEAVKNAITEASDPSLLFFWIALIAQTTLLILALVYN